MAGQPRRSARIRVSTVVSAGSVVLGLALIAGLAVVWPGFDAKQTPPDNAAVWAMQAGEGRRYARVNTQLGELDTVKSVENPSRLVQTGDHLMVYTDSDSRFAEVSAATPVDLDDSSSDALKPAPSGTRTVAAAGDYLAYLTDSGSVLGATVDGEAGPIPFDPYAGQAPQAGGPAPRFAADAVAVDSAGIVYAYSSGEGKIFRADIASGRVLGIDTVPGPLSGDAQLSAVGGRWVLLDEGSGSIWVQGRAQAIPTPEGGDALLQQATAAGAASRALLVADRDGLLSVPLDGSAVQRIVGSQGSALGTPAVPSFLGGTAYGAWLPAGTAGGMLWSSDAGTRALDYAGAPLGDDAAPVFQSNGSRMILNETRSGWVWTVPDGALVASSQNWTSDEQAQQRQSQQNEQTQRVIDPKPPVAEPDSFGVRAGRDVVLPVLLNDHDPNEDVLTVVPASVQGLDPAFGTLTTVNDDQEIVVSVAPGATGTARFSYRVTDGTSADGLQSASATVTLTVVPEDVNRPPEWCGVEGCLAQWPSPQLVPGGTVSADALRGWVDPDGDPVFLSAATNLSGVGAVAFDPAGTIVYQHPDPNSTAAVSVPIEATVSDSRGASASKTLTVTVTPQPHLSVESFAAVGTAGQPLVVEPLPHVSGAIGAPRLTEAKPLDETDSRAVVNGNASTFEFTSSQPGSYLVSITVADDAGQSTGTVRVTMLDPAAARLSVAPTTAFVYPGQDATVDLFSAVSNPSGLVLMLSDVDPVAAPTSAMSVDTLGQSLLRVAGATEDGKPGLLGTVGFTVSDGSGRTDATARGQLTVILLAAPAPEAPIARNDAVTVRAGAQADVPVLDNDQAPAGLLIALDPSRVSYDPSAGLAFASGRTLRYLAPQTPGTYVVSYTVYALGYPELSDTAQLVVTVLGPEANLPPAPRPLTGRVLSGRSVSIPFDGYAVDPDGDMVTLDRILGQPASGSASIAADGTAIVYTSAPGFQGQVSFRYQVRDANGATGESEVRIGVLAAQSDPSPVAYTDYVQVQQGGGTVVVDPAENDIDPTRGSLEVTEVHPDAEPGSAEYAALAAMIGPVRDGKVTVTAGEALGTYSYVYTVRNAQGDTAMGLIVVKVVRGSVPDYPVVTDTILTAATRDSFSTGVDVVTGKVSWASGDVSGLTLSLWGQQQGVAVDGWRISGQLPERALLIPFQLSGRDFSGRLVTSYGFLRVPGQEDVRLSLKASAAVQQVREKESVTFDMASATVMPPGSSLQVDGAHLTTEGSRAEASCSLLSGTTVQYSAGAGAPWTDSCTVPVRLASQQDWTYLVVRIQIQAAVPQPQLRPASVTVGPGQTLSYDLAQMTSWTGAEDWASLRYQTAYSSADASVTQSGSVLTIVAADDARPGRESLVTVSLPSHPDALPSALTIKIGPAPAALPKGATVPKECSEAGGATSCDIPVIGMAGEVNPLPGTPLQLVSVGSPSGSCTGVSFAVADASTVRASWSADAPGGTCTSAFVVQDAQGRQSSGGRNGSVILDLQGLPAAPASLTQIAFGDRTLTLQVNPGPAANAYPALGGFTIYRDGQEVQKCTASGSCAPISVARNGDPQQYSARAFNDVGESRSQVTTSAWAYVPPVVSSAHIESVYRTGGVATSPQQGVLHLSITSSDESVRSYEVSGPGVSPFTVDRAGRQTVEQDVAATAGTAVTLTVVPRTGLPVPELAGATPTGTGVATNTVTAVGAPLVGDIQVTDRSDSSLTVSLAGVSGNGAPDSAVQIVYAAYLSDAGSFTCTADDSGGMRTAVTGGRTSGTTTIGGLTPNRRYTVAACVGNGYGAVRTTNDPSEATIEVMSEAELQQRLDRAGFRYAVQDGSASGQYPIVLPPASQLPRIPDYGTPTLGAPVGWGTDPQILVRYCLTVDPGQCVQTFVQPQDPHAAWQVRVNSVPLPRCVYDGGDDDYLPAPTASFEGPGQVYYLGPVVYSFADGSQQQLDPAQPIPAGATGYTVTIQVSWSADAVSSLQPYARSASGACEDRTPAPPPSTDPTPTGEPTPADGGAAGAGTGTSTERNQG